MNLQFADGGLLLDLPFDPMRLEQRLGRMDRMGRRGLIQCSAILSISDPTLAFDAAWHEVLLVYAALLFDSPIFPGRAAPGKRKDNDQQVGGIASFGAFNSTPPLNPRSRRLQSSGSRNDAGACRGRAERTGAQIERCDRYTTAQQYSAYPNVIAITPRLLVRHPLRHSVVIWIFG